MRRLVLIPLAVSALLTAVVQAQNQKPQKEQKPAKAAEPVDMEMVAKIREEGLKRSQVMQHLFYLTEVSGPRLAGSPNFMKAANWAKGRLDEWGLHNPRLEEWGELGRSWSLQKFTLEMTKPYYQPLIGYPKALVGSTSGPIKGRPIIFASKSNEDLEKYKGKLKNAILLTRPKQSISTKFEPDARRFTREQLLALANAGTPSGSPLALPQKRARQLQTNQPDNASDSSKPTRRRRVSRRRGLSPATLKFLREEGAGVLLSPTSKGHDGTLFVTGGGSRTIGEKPGIPAVVMTGEHYNRLYRLVEAGIDIEVLVNIQVELHEDDPTDYNVLAEIPGVDPELKDEIVMMGAHLDSWHSSTGATDNAGGCSVMMEAARILSTLGVGPRRTIRIGLWGAEETGLRGSRGYVEKNHKSGTPGHEKFSAYFNYDNGAGAIRGIRQQGNAGVRSIFEAWLRPFHDIEAQTVSLTSGGGTDHLSFDRAGLPGFGFLQDPIHYSTRTHHSNMDGYDHVIADDLKKSAVIIASFVYHAAMRDEKLPRKPPPKSRQPKTEKKADQKTDKSEK